MALLAGAACWAVFYIAEWLENKKSEENPVSTDYSLIDYSVYRMNFIEKCIAFAMAAGFMYALLFIFFKSVFVVIPAIVLALVYPSIKAKELLRARKRQLSLQFRQALYSLSTSLAAGRSIENAFIAVIDDLRLLYSAADTYIIREFEVIARKIENGEQIEKAVSDFSKRADCEDIRNFSDVFSTCKRTGGDLIEVMRRTSNIIGEKLEIEQDIAVMVTQKRLEARLLSVIPYVIIAFLSFSSPDYMQPLYEFNGRLIMAGALVLLLTSSWVMKRMMEIKV
jgi:tight adherence protein B